MERFELPGYAVEAPYGERGWRARDERTGRAVLLRRVSATGPTRGDLVRRRVARLGGLESPVLLPPHTVVTTDDALVPVWRLPSGGSLAALLDVRPHLEVGEVVTLGTALGGALAVLHGAGVVAGPLRADDVLLAGDGTPVLAVPADVEDSEAGWSPADDVRSAAGLCLAVLHVPEESAGATAIAARLSEVSDAAEADAGRLAAALRGAGPGVPLRPPASAVILGDGSLDNPRGDPRPDRGDDSPVPLDRGGDSPVPLNAGGDSPVPLDRGGESGFRSRGAPSTPDEPTADPLALRRHVRERPSWPRRFGLAALAALALVTAAALGLRWGHAGVGDGAAPLAPPTVAASAAGVATGLPGTEATPPATRATSLAGPGTSSSAASAPSNGSAGYPRGRTASPTISRPADRSVDAAGWRAVLDALDTSRAQALETADKRALVAVDVAGSPALRRDEELVDRLAALGAYARGLRWELLGLVVEPARPPDVTLQVTDRMPGYDLVDRSGALLARRPPRSPQTWRIVLRPQAGRWRMFDAAAVDHVGGGARASPGATTR